MVPMRASSGFEKMPQVMALLEAIPLLKWSISACASSTEVAKGRGMYRITSGSERRQNKAWASCSSILRNISRSVKRRGGGDKQNVGDMNVSM